MMIIKGHNIKPGKELQSNCLYRTETSTSIRFEEKDTNDVVNVIFSLKDKQYGIYGTEYKPPFVEDNGTKKADLLCLVIDEDCQKFSSWIFDVKKTVGGEDVIFHLVEQLKQTLLHKNSIIAELPDFIEDEHIGYITQEYQESRIKSSIECKIRDKESKQKTIECLPITLRNKIEIELMKDGKAIRILNDFYNNSIYDGKKYHCLERHISEEESGKYVFDLHLACS